MAMDKFGQNMLQQFTENNGLNGGDFMKGLSRLMVDTTLDKFRENSVKIYVHLMPYIFILAQLISTRKVPARIQEIRLLTLTVLFHAIEIKSSIKTENIENGFSHFIGLQIISHIFTLSYWTKLSTLIAIVVMSRKVIEEKKELAPVRFFTYIRSRMHLNRLDAFVILVTVILNFTSLYGIFEGSSNIPWGILLSSRAVIDFIECGILFANYKLKGCDIDQNDMIGFGLTILAYTYDYKAMSIFPISFALYYITIGLFDKLRGKIEIRIFSPEAPKNEIAEIVEAQKNEVVVEDVHEVEDDVQAVCEDQIVGQVEDKEEFVFVGKGQNVGKSNSVKTVSSQYVKGKISKAQTRSSTNSPKYKLDKVQTKK